MVGQTNGNNRLYFTDEQGRLVQVNENVTLLLGLQKIYRRLPSSFLGARAISPAVRRPGALAGART
jgi:hypothetical protein